MPKRRKRTNKNVPAKGRLRDMADQLWSVAVRADWASKCAVCGTGKTEAHHLLPRQHQSTRYLLENGMALCSRHHQFCPDVSPHQNAPGFMFWLEDHQHGVWDWLVSRIDGDLAYQRFNGTTNAAYYCDVIRDLRQYVSDEDFERICGIKFSQYLSGVDSLE